MASRFRRRALGCLCALFGLPPGSSGARRSSASHPRRSPAPSSCSPSSFAMKRARFSPSRSWSVGKAASSISIWTVPSGGTANPCECRSSSIPALPGRGISASATRSPWLTRSPSRAGSGSLPGSRGRSASGGQASPSSSASSWRGPDLRNSRASCGIAGCGWARDFALARANLGRIAALASAS